MSEELQVTSYNVQNIIADESLFTMLRFFNAPSRIIRLYKLLYTSTTPETERNIAEQYIEQSEFNFSAVNQLIIRFNKHLETVANKSVSQDSKTKNAAINKKRNKTKPKTPITPKACQACKKKLTKQTTHKLPHNYGGLIRYLYVCTDCLPDIIAVIGHRITTRPITFWR